MKRIAIFLTLWGMCLSATSQITEVRIDLANTKKIPNTIPPGTVKITIENQLTRKYKYEITKNMIDVIPIPIKIETEKTESGDMDLLQPPAIDPCEPIHSEILALDKAQSEEEVSKKSIEIKNRIKNDDCKKILPYLENKMKELQSSFYIENLKKNQKITLKIRRSDTTDNMKDLKIWEFELRTESDMDNWIIHYGFTYIPSILMRNSQYFSEADANGSYVVRKMNNKPENEWRNGSPTVSFTHPFNKVYKKDMFGMSIVTGTNFSTYNAGLGLSYIRGYNGLFTAGVMYTQKDALNGQYKDGSVLKENLNFDQLHYKKGGIEFFFSLSLRLDKNPFAEISEKK